MTLDFGHPPSSQCPRADGKRAFSRTRRHASASRSSAGCHDFYTKRVQPSLILPDEQAEGRCGRVTRTSFQRPP